MAAVLVPDTSSISTAREREKLERECDTFANALAGGGAPTARAPRRFVEYRTEVDADELRASRALATARA
ncbi:hypothetical protein [Actinotalea solisilvae]|uniref:hypothetical protein n=1 Tax=Actinotalea solisilvae TaxID=2072922 RepID=UPI0018F249A6|nr:hypothetical protein [Actinotalea solisilvae]